jgi:hypothetical protein
MFLLWTFKPETSSVSDSSVLPLKVRELRFPSSLVGGSTTIHSWSIRSRAGDRKGRDGEDDMMVEGRGVGIEASVGNFEDSVERSGVEGGEDCCCDSEDCGLTVLAVL